MFHSEDPFGYDHNDLSKNASILRRHQGVLTD